MTYLVRIPKDIGHALRQVRRQKKLTQKELASISGVWQETISKIENGVGGAKIDTICNLLAALDLEITVAPRSKGSADIFGDIF